MVARTEYIAIKIRESAVVLRDYANELDRYSKKLEDTGEWHWVSSCVNSLANLMSNVRVDLMAAVPIRELEREIHELKGSKE